MNSSKIKVAALIILAIFVSAFVYFITTKEVPKEAPNSAGQSSGSGFSVVPPSNSKLIADYSPILGPDEAPVTIVEFLDPECEACKAMYPIVKRVMAEYEGKVRLVVRYMPFHTNSIFAAQVLESAGEQGQYWKAMELFFEQQEMWASHHDPKPELLFQLTSNLGLDNSKIKANIESGKFKDQIMQDKTVGEELGVTRTPTFFVNGEELTEMGYGPLRALVQKKLDVFK